MDVHMVAPRYHPVTGGIETHVRHVADAARDRGHDVTVHCLRHDASLPAEDVVDGAAVRRYDPVLEVGYYTTLFVPEIPDDAVAHLHAFGHLTNHAVLRDHDPGRCLLTTHHGVAFPTPGVAATIYHALYRRFQIPRLADLHRVVTVNDADRDRLLRRGVPRDRVETIPNGVPEAAFEDADPPREGHVLFLGRLHEEKRVGDLIRCLPDLDVDVVVAGPDAGRRDELEALADRLGVDDRVEFAGRVDEPDKRGLLAGARCLALPSRHEGQGIVVLEAWAQGTPVVATRTNGVQGMVEDGTDGLLVDVGDVDGLRAALRSLVDDPDRADEMGARGREKAWERYRWEVVAGRVVDLYEDVEA